MPMRKTKLAQDMEEMGIKKGAGHKIGAKNKRRAPVPLSVKTEVEQQIEIDTGKNLTMRARRFAELYVEGTYTLAQCVREAGFKAANPAAYGHHLMNPKESPQVVALIRELQEQRQRQYGVTLEGQLKRLSDLSHGAERANQFSAAINAEKLRSVLGGLTVDRREQINSVDDLTREQIVGRLESLIERYPQLASLKDVTPKTPVEAFLGTDTGSETLDIDAEELAIEGDGPED